MSAFAKLVDTEGRVVPTNGWIFGKVLKTGRHFQSNNLYCRFRTITQGFQQGLFGKQSKMTNWQCFEVRENVGHWTLVATPIPDIHINTSIHLEIGSKKLLGIRSPIPPLPWWKRGSKKAAYFRSHSNCEQMLVSLGKYHRTKRHKRQRQWKWQLHGEIQTQRQTERQRPLKMYRSLAGLINAIRGFKHLLSSLFASTFASRAVSSTDNILQQSDNLDFKNLPFLAIQLLPIHRLKV